jgi:hypothetical protein
MSKSLKDFVNQNREALDTRQPSDKVWNGIESSLPQMKQHSLWNSLVVWRVAAVLLLGLSVFLFATRPTSTFRRSEIVKIQKEFLDQELFYKDQIAEKVALIDNLNNAFEDDLFTEDFQKLDAMYQVLLEEMKTKPSEKVRDALILNMLVRIDLLNQQIKKLEDKTEKPAKETAI